MKRSDLIDSLVMTKHQEDGEISFSTRCPEESCPVTEESVVHYGDENEAKISVINKIFAHLKIYHKIEIVD